MAKTGADDLNVASVSEPVITSGDYAPGGHAYHRLMIALPAAGMATFAPLYSAHGLLPRIGTTFGVSESTSSLYISSGTIGLTLGALVWSVLGDKYGRPKVMKAAMLIAVVLGALTIAMPTFPLILATRVLQGFALGALPTLAMAYLSEQVERRYTVIAAGAFISGNTVGGLSGRLIAAPIGAALGWRWGVGAVLIVSLVATIIFCVTLPPPHTQLKTIGSVSEMLSNVWAHLRTPWLDAVYLQGFLLFGGFIGTYNYLTYRLEGEPFNMPTSLVSLLFIAYLAGTVSARLTGGWAIRWGRRRVINAGAAIYALGLILTLVNNVFVILVGLVILTGGFFMCQAIASGWAGALPTKGTAQSTSLYNMGYYAGSAVLGYLSGFPYRWFGWPGVVVTVLLFIALAQTLILLRKELADS
ncbi:MAG: MFS transporter [Propionibacteriaceae bacterium]|nr:MFS transporter [Propionibacteriaceae bacterium]